MRVRVYCTALQAKRGGLKDTLPDDMLAAVFQATLQRTRIDPKVRVVVWEPFGCPQQYVTAPSSSQGVTCNQEPDGPPSVISPEGSV